MSKISLKEWLMIKLEDMSNFLSMLTKERERETKHEDKLNLWISTSKNEMKRREKLSTIFLPFKNLIPSNGTKNCTEDLKIELAATQNWLFIYLFILYGKEALEEEGFKQYPHLLYTCTPLPLQQKSCWFFFSFFFVFFFSLLCIEKCLNLWIYFIIFYSRTKTQAKTYRKK